MPIIVPDYSKGYGAGLESMISQMANTMAGADDDDEEEVEDGALLSAAEKRRALRDISPHMIKQIGYYECLHQFNRNITRGGSRAIPGPKKSNLLVGLELLNALTENDDWTLEFVFLGEVFPFLRSAF
ncbi:hypothetical protein FIBSPDRAFT_505043 [Athelia psychrophila]|uniref:Uncharacterized protein n=1 Tax=Athelia psychrophila TaxID=1759441 RepID=A0A166K852_9AGAM|nr:hypothetical protein FIBSPDRAFT_505043 [Fibularhizoctonia sp. CBS 109695]